MQPSQQSFLTLCYPIAKQVSETSGIPIVAMLAVSAVESKWGQQVRANNYFGIKSTSGWKGGKVQFVTTEFSDNINAYPGGKLLSTTKNAEGKYCFIITASFRGYPNVLDSFEDFAAFIIDNPRYNDCINVSDPFVFLNDLAYAGYATNPVEKEMLLTVAHEIEKFIGELGLA